MKCAPRPGTADTPAAYARVREEEESIGAMDRDLPEDDLLHDPVRPEESGAAIVLRLLRGAGVDGLEEISPDDVDAVTDRFFDHAEIFEGPRLLHLLTGMIAPRIHERATALCERYFLMLDVRAVSDEAVLRAFTGFLAGARERPFRAWCEKLLRESVRWAIDSPEFWVFKGGRDATPRERIMGELSRLSNHLDIQARRVVWMHWVEHRDLSSISTETGVPLERAEWILDTVLEQAKAIVIEDIANGNDERAKRRDFERAHGIDDRDLREFEDEFDENDDGEEDEEEGERVWPPLRSTRLHPTLARVARGQGAGDGDARSQALRARGSGGTRADPRGRRNRDRDGHGHAPHAKDRSVHRPCAEATDGNREAPLRPADGGRLLGTGDGAVCGGDGGSGYVHRERA